MTNRLIHWTQHLHFVYSVKHALYSHTIAYVCTCVHLLTVCGLLLCGESQSLSVSARTYVADVFLGGEGSPGGEESQAEGRHGSLLHSSGQGMPTARGGRAD